MVILDFRGIATTRKHKEKKEALAMLKLVEARSAKHLLFGINRMIRLEMEGASYMAVFQLAQELKQARRLYVLAIENEAGGFDEWVCFIVEVN